MAPFALPARAPESQSPARTTAGAALLGGVVWTVVLGTVQLVFHYAPALAWPGFRDEALGPRLVLGFAIGAGAAAALHRLRPRRHVSAGAVGMAFTAGVSWAALLQLLQRPVDAWWPELAAGAVANGVLWGLLVLGYRWLYGERDARERAARQSAALELASLERDMRPPDAA